MSYDNKHDNKNQENTPKMIDSDFMSMVGSQFLPMIKRLARYEPDTIKEQMELTDHAQQTLFLHVIAGARSTSMQIEAIDFFWDQGFDFKRMFPITPSFERMYNPTAYPGIPDYLRSWQYLTDDAFSYLSKRLGQDYLLSLEKDDYPLLHFAFAKGHTTTIELLTQFGFDYDKVDNRSRNPRTVLDAAQSNTGMISLYWENKKRIAGGVWNEQEVFEKTRKWFIDQLSWNEFKDKGLKDPVTTTLLKELPTFTVAHQEELIGLSVMAKEEKYTPRLLNKYALQIKEAKNTDNQENTTQEKLKPFNTMKNYDPQSYPLWLNIGKTNRHDWFHFFAGEKNIPLDSYSEKIKLDPKNHAYNKHSNHDGVMLKNNYPYDINSYLSQIALHLQEMKYQPQGSYGISKATEARNYSISKTLNHMLEPDFFMAKNSHDHMNNWFVTIAKSSFLSFYFREQMDYTVEHFKTYYSEEDYNKFCDMAKKSKYPVPHYENRFKPLHEAWWKISNIAETYESVIRNSVKNQGYNQSVLDSIAKDQDKQAIFQEIMANTWFAHDEKGVTAIEHYFSHCTDIPKVLNVPYLELDQSVTLFTTEQKILYLELLLPHHVSYSSYSHHVSYSSYSQYENKPVMALLDNLQNDQCVIWSKSKISEEDKAEMRRTEHPALAIIEKCLWQENLHNSLPMKNTQKRGKL